jgi:hypothetical protein
MVQFPTKESTVSLLPFDLSAKAPDFIARSPDFEYDAKLMSYDVVLGPLGTYKLLKPTIRTGFTTTAIDANLRSKLAMVRGGGHLLIHGHGSATTKYYGKIIHSLAAPPEEMMNFELVLDLIEQNIANLDCFVWLMICHSSEDNGVGKLLRFKRRFEALGVRGLFGYFGEMPSIHSPLGLEERGKDMDEILTNGPSWDDMLFESKRRAVRLAAMRRQISEDDRVWLKRQGHTVAPGWTCMHLMRKRGTAILAHERVKKVRLGQVTKTETLETMRVF